MTQNYSSETNPSPEVAAYKHARYGFFIAAAGSLIVLIFSFINCFQLSTQESWIKTDASIQSVVIKERKEYYPELWITYQYKAGGKSITATTVERTNTAPSAFTKWKSGYAAAMESVQKIKTRLEKSGQLSVYYNPSAPAESQVGRMDVSVWIMLYGALSGVCALIFIGSVWILCHPVKPRTPSIKEYGQIGSTDRTNEDQRIANRSIIESLHNRTPAGDQSKPGQFESTSIDVTAGDAIDEDGSTIDLKKREKETL